MHSAPSQAVLTAGRYSSGLSSNTTTAPSARYRLQPLLKWIGPESHSPAGTTTRPPPALLQASMALAMAAVLARMSPFRAP